MAVATVKKMVAKVQVVVQVEETELEMDLGQEMEVGTAVVEVEGEMFLGNYFLCLLLNPSKQAQTLRILQI